MMSECITGVALYHGGGSVLRGQLCITWKALYHVDSCVSRGQLCITSVALYHGGWAVTLVDIFCRRIIEA